MYYILIVSDTTRSLIFHVLGYAQEVVNSEKQLAHSCKSYSYELNIIFVIVAPLMSYIPWYSNSHPCFHTMSWVSHFLAYPLLPVLTPLESGGQSEYKVWGRVRCISYTMYINTALSEWSAQQGRYLLCLHSLRPINFDVTSGIRSGQADYICWSENASFSREKQQWNTYLNNIYLA